MGKSILITMDSEELEALVIRSVNSALALNNMAVSAARSLDAASIPITIERACEITGLAKSTIYYLAPKGLIPCQKRGKRLYFFESELIEWIRSGKNQSAQKRKEVSHV